MEMKDPLDIDERQRVLNASLNMGFVDGVEPYKVIATLMYTGCHPSVLADRGKSRIRVVGNHIEWIRPKKRGSAGYTRVLIHKKLEPWIENFLLSDLPTFREWYWGLCKKVGKKAGIPDLSPMTLRHTFGVILDEMGFTPAEIQEMMNCSLPVLMRYTRRSKEQIDNKLINKGWTG